MYDERYIKACPERKSLLLISVAVVSEARPTLRILGPDSPQVRDLLETGLSVEILTQPAGEGGGQGVRTLRADLLHYLVVRLPPEVLEVLLLVLREPGEVPGEVGGGGEGAGVYVGVRREMLGVVTTSVHHRHCPRLTLWCEKRKYFRTFLPTSRARNTFSEM